MYAAAFHFLPPRNTINISCSPTIVLRVIEDPLWNRRGVDIGIQSYSSILSEKSVESFQGEYVIQISIMARESQ